MKVFQRLNLAAKQVGTLYHITNLDGMEFIMRDNKLRRGSYSGISFSRDKMLNSYIGDRPRSYFKLIIDGNKLSNKYKIEPYKYHSRNDNVNFRNEAEELIKVNEIPNVDKYIKGVAFIYRNFENNEREFVSKYKNPLLKYLDEMDTKMFFVLIFVGILVIIGGVAIITSNTDNDDSNLRTQIEYCNARSTCHWSSWRARCVCE